MMNSVTRTFVHPPGTEWLQEFTSMKKEQGQINDVRDAIGEFTKSVTNQPGSFQERAYTVCGIVYEQAFRLARTAKSFLKENNIRLSFQILDKDEGDPVNSFRLKVGDDILKIKEKDDHDDMIQEAMTG